MWDTYTFKGAPIWGIALTIVIPAVITYLSLYPGSRALRIGLLPIALMGMWITLWNYRFETPDDAPLLELSTLSAGIRYTITKTPPTTHPLPRQPPLAFLRNNDIFKTFNLLSSEFRHVNIPPNPPLPSRNKAGQSGRGYFSSITYHATNMIFHFTLLDFILYPAYILDPTGVGSPYPGGGGDLGKFCKRYGGGSLEWTIWVWMILAAGVGMCVATMGTYHLFALFFVGSGIWIDEEFPRFMDQPWRADSLNDLWGKRYHQLLRDTLILWTIPFKSLPRSIYILIIFAASALFHIIISIPFPRHNNRAYLIFYTSQGFGCILERIFRNITGKRVGGWVGRVWTWGWMIIWAGGMVTEYYGTGWVGMMRGRLHEGGMSPADGVARWLGWGKVGE